MVTLRRLSLIFLLCVMAGRTFADQLPPVVLSRAAQAARIRLSAAAPVATTLFTRYDSPSMISNNAPAPFTALADSEYASIYKVFQAFDRDAWPSYWNSAESAYPHYAQLDDGPGKSNAVASIYLFSYVGYGGYDGNYAYSQDGSTWTTQTTVALPNTQHNTITNSTPVYARYHRVTFTSGYSTALAYYEMEFTSSADNEPMTSATTPAPQAVMATTDNPGTGNEAYKAFDRDYQTTWDSSHTSSFPQSITYKYGSNQVINGLMILPYPGYGWSNFVVSASLDNYNFTFLYAGMLANASTNQYFDIPTSAPYQYYRITGSNGYNPNIVSLYEIQFKQYK